MNPLIVLVLILVMVAFNALYVAAEFATVGARRSRVQERAESGSGTASSLLSILQDPKRLDAYVAACQIGITLSSLVAGAWGQAQLTPLFERVFGAGGQTLAIIVVLLFVTSLQVVLGELLPKTIALRYPERLAMATLAPMRISQWLFRPLVALFNGSAFAVMKALGLSVDHSHSHVHSPQELAGLYRASADGGLIDNSEREMLAGALSVNKRLVREIMTPRRKMVTIDGSAPVAVALAELSASPYSRFPVTDGGEEIVGVVSLRELFIASRNDPAAEDGPPTVADVIEPPVVVGEVLEVPVLLAQFAEEAFHVAIVVNEFGSVSGLVTREDAIEEIMGELNDEFDVEPDPITIEGDTVWLRGDVLLSVVNDRFDLDLPADEIDTISGYIWQELGRLPEVGDTVKLIERPRADDSDDENGEPVEPPERLLTVDSVDGTLVDRASFTVVNEDQ